MRTHAKLAVCALLAALLAPANPAHGQIAQFIKRAVGGETYQILQRINSQGGGIGLEDVRITTLIGTTTGAAQPCLFAGAIGGAPSEAFASSGELDAFPIGLAFKSDLIADASPPCFNTVANSGDGIVCIGPDCNNPLCTCPVAGACVTFTIQNGTLMTTDSAAAPQAKLLTPIDNPGPQCLRTAKATYIFGAATATPTTAAALCSAEPTDGFLLPMGNSAFGGVNGTTLIIAYASPPGSSFSIAASGFSIDRDGSNTLGCSANQVLSAVGEADSAAAQLPPDTATPDPTTTPETGMPSPSRTLEQGVMAPAVAWPGMLILVGLLAVYGLYSAARTD